MELTVGITCFDRPDRYEKCVASLSRASGHFNVIVFDDASTSISHDITKKYLPSAKIFKSLKASGRADFAIATLMRLLVDHGDEHCMLLDSDMVVDKDFAVWLRQNFYRSQGVLSLFNSISHPEISSEHGLVAKRSIGSAGAVFTRDLLRTIVTQVKPSRRYDWDWSEHLTNILGIQIYVSKRSYVQHLGISTGQNSAVNLGDWGEGFQGYDSENLGAIFDEFDKVNRYLLSKIYESKPHLGPKDEVIAGKRSLIEKSKLFDDPVTVDAAAAEKFFKSAEPMNRNLVLGLKSFIPKSNSITIFDVGSNAGYFSKIMLEEIECDEIVLFEPIPNLLSLAVKTLSKFTVKKVFVCAALGERDERSNIFLPGDGNIGWITLVSEKSTNPVKLTINIVESKRYIEKYMPLVIKMDVEGYESIILWSFLEMINPAYRPIFLVELGWGVSNPNWPKFMLAADRFHGLGYAFIDSSNKLELSREELANLAGTKDVFIIPK
jgi:FkbM family methyltransferase